MSREMVDFWKYEGTANDFVLLEAPTDAVDLDPTEVARLCDRHCGVGADGVLLVIPPAADRSTRARMIVRNADGSRPEMCGNGVRCVALHVCTRLGEAGVVEIDSDAGVRRCRLEMARGADGEIEWFVTVGMGTVRVGETIVLQHPSDAERTVTVTRVDTGNPHAVTFDAISDVDVDVLGASLQRGDARFPNGVNLERVSFRAHVQAHVASSEDPGASRAVTVEVAVFERGVGRTRACGTGACAVAGALVARGEAQLGRPITVVLAGGPLQITLEHPASTIHDDRRPHEAIASMRGPARRVFAGRFPLSPHSWKLGTS